MEVFLGAFLLLTLAVTGMSVGAILQGKRLSGSCGGRLPDGTLVGDCLCEKAKQEACAAGEAPPAAVCDLGGAQ